MRTVFTCAACRHTEQSDARESLMARVRMWNHVNRAHPELIERFRDVVFSESLTPEEASKTLARS